MWTRRELKDRAKQVLKGNYWKAFLISLVIAFAGGNGGGGGGSAGGGSSSYNNYNNYRNYLPFDITIPNIALIGSAVIAVTLSVIALRIFLGYPLEVGGRKFFVKSAQYEDNSGCFRYAFERENYMGIISAMLLKAVQNFLWFLLFIIPGIIKAYAYSMVPYILSDNPNIGAKDAIRLSNEMTQGHKFEMFILDLSFIGWYLLGALAFGIGVLFVMPYTNATKAELYLVISSNKLAES